MSKAAATFAAPLAQTARLVEALRQKQAEASTSAEASVDSAEPGTSAEAPSDSAEATDQTEG
jgi:large subunit ribosomal protein L10